MNKSSSLSSASSSSASTRRQPRQERGKQRVERILVAAAEVFAEVGFAAATIQQIADRAETAVGSIYQFFPDKAEIFRALALTHIQQAQAIDAMFLATDLRRSLRSIVDDFVELWAVYLEEPIPRCVILQYQLPAIQALLSQAKFQENEARSLQQHSAFYRLRNPQLSEEKSRLLVEVSGSICNHLMLLAIAKPQAQRAGLYAELKDVIYGYLDPHIGDRYLQAALQKDDLPNQVMACPSCQSHQISKNGHHQTKQRYRCQDCGRQFVDRYVQRGYPPDVRQHCLSLYQQGISLREIQRQTGVNHNTVSNWVKAGGELR